MLKAEVCTRAKWPIKSESIPVSSVYSDNEYHYYPLDVMLVHCRQETTIQLLKIPHCSLLSVI